MNNPLLLDDIEDLRTYERGRQEYRRRVIELKRRRRVGVGPFVTFVFENRETVRFQVQEMARAERMMTDQQIQGELDIYNALLPSPGELSATMFIELTDEALTAGMAAEIGGHRAIGRIEGGRGGMRPGSGGGRRPGRSGGGARGGAYAAQHHVIGALPPLPPDPAPGGSGSPPDRSCWPSSTPTTGTPPSSTTPPDGSCSLIWMGEAFTTDRDDGPLPAEERPRTSGIGTPGPGLPPGRAWAAGRGFLYTGGIRAQYCSLRCFPVQGTVVPARGCASGYEH